jgi:hypothetical protein
MKPSGLLLYLLLILSFSISGQILNRSFELTVPTEPNGSPVYFIPPLNWQYENYAGVHDKFFPVTERGRVPDWSITNAFDGDRFLVLTTGNLGPGSDLRISEAKVWQRVFLPAWTLIQGVYFFGTSDYWPYNDYGAVQLIPFVDPNYPCDPNNPCNRNDPNNPCDPNDTNNLNCCPQLSTIELARCSVKDVGDFGNTGGWVPFSYTISPKQEGIYDMVLIVKDGIDSVYESYFAIDDLSICGPLSPIGDVNKDCHVDMDDLAFFSREWLQTCSIDPNSIPDPNDPNYISDPNAPGYIDPNNLTDPNCMCADFTRDNVVDANDLYPIYDNWLIKDI